MLSDTMPLFRLVVKSMQEKDQKVTLELDQALEGADVLDLFGMKEKITLGGSARIRVNGM